MEELKDLKDVLERVEGKLLVVKYVHVALAFVYWSTVLAVFYLILDIVRRIPGEYAMAFWIFAIILYYPIWRITKKIWSKPKDFSLRSFALKMFIPLIVILILNFYVVGVMATLISPDRAIAIGLLCSISAYLLIIALIVRAKEGRFPKEMLPAILTFAFSPLVLIVDDPLIFIGYVIMATYGVTALIFLIKAVGVVEDGGS